MNLLDTASLVVTPNAYKTSKLYSIVPTNGTGDITFARTGDTATRVNSAGLIETVLANRPRLDYLGSTCPKLLIEPQRTNLSLYSEQFDNAAWTTFKGEATVSANTTVAPDGNSSADSILVSATANVLHYIQQRTGVSLNATTYTMSCYVKKLGYDYCRLQLSDVGTGIAIFRFSTKTIALSGANVVANSGRVEELTNDWFRISFSILTTSAGAWRWWIIPLNNTGQDVFTGDITKGLYAWGFQVEQGSFVTSYIPTTTASVTRNQDIAEKTAITSLIGQTEGTLFVDFVFNRSEDSISSISINNGTTNNRIAISLTGGLSIGGGVRDGGIVQADFFYTLAVGSRYKCAIAYKANDFVFYINGNLIGSDNSGTVPASLSKFALDNGSGSAFRFNYPVNSSVLWKTRLTNQELATLTTI